MSGDGPALTELRLPLLDRGETLVAIADHYGQGGRIQYTIIRDDVLEVWTVVEWIDLYLRLRRGWHQRFDRKAVRP